jgi:hypothetical protein
MSIFSIICWTFVASFWVGFAWRDRAYRRAHPNQAELIGQQIIDAARQIECQRKFSGPQIALFFRSELEMHGQKFPLVVTDSETAKGLVE